MSIGKRTDEEIEDLAVAIEDYEDRFGFTEGTVVARALCEWLLDPEASSVEAFLAQQKWD